MPGARQPPMAWTQVPPPQAMHFAAWTQQPPMPWQYANEETWSWSACSRGGDSAAWKIGVADAKTPTSCSFRYDCAIGCGDCAERRSERMRCEIHAP